MWKVWKAGEGRDADWKQLNWEDMERLQKDITESITAIKTKRLKINHLVTDGPARYEFMGITNTGNLTMVFGYLFNIKGSNVYA